MPRWTKHSCYIRIKSKQKPTTNLRRETLRTRRPLPNSRDSVGCSCPYLYRPLLWKLFTKLIEDRVSWIVCCSIRCRRNDSAKCLTSTGRLSVCIARVLPDACCANGLSSKSAVASSIAACWYFQLIGRFIYMKIAVILIFQWRNIEVEWTVTGIFHIFNAIVSYCMGKLTMCCT